MKYKIGDKVRIKSLEWYEKNKDNYGDVRVPNGADTFVKDMSNFCGKIAIITGTYGIKYKIKGFNYYWCDFMFEPNNEQLEFNFDD